MSSSDVTRDGLTGARPDREARPRNLRRRGRRGEQLMVPEAEFTSYYGKPVLNEPVWEPELIGGYFFLGGLAGGSSLLAEGAERTDHPTLARAAKITAAGAITLSLGALVADLGRPARFLNMLRVFKPTSPMSVGSWLVAGYAPLAIGAAASSVSGRVPGLGRLATVSAAGLGPAVASYTAVLMCDTAVPAWHEAYRQMPFAFVGSGMSAAGGMGMLAAPLRESGPALRLATIGSALEVTALRHAEHRLGEVAEPYSHGGSGRLMKAAEALTVTGTALGQLGRRSRVLTAIAGGALVTASALTRLGIFQAGMQSAKDPKYTVRPQRARADARSATGSAPEHSA